MNEQKRARDDFEKEIHAFFISSTKAEQRSLYIFGVALAKMTDEQSKAYRDTSSSEEMKRRADIALQIVEEADITISDKSFYELANADLYKLFIERVFNIGGAG
jgi:hypothetical protein